MEITLKMLKKIVFGGMCVVTMTVSAAASAGSLSAGPLYDEFPLTLDPGHRTEIFGPFYYDEQKDTEHTWALPPFFSRENDPAVEAAEDDYLYPIFTREHFGKEHRSQFCQIFAFAGGAQPDDSIRTRFTLFPLYFQQRSTVPDDNYTAVFPFYGHLKDRLFRDRIFFVMFPFYGQSQKKDIVTENYLYPFVHIRHGDSLYGWQVWPFAGHEHKDITWLTNGFGDVEMSGGHDRLFVLWPFYLRQNNDIGTPNPEKDLASIPFFSIVRSPMRDSTSVLWPFFTWIDDRGKKYWEWQGPYPFVVVARGSKTTTRVLPLFERSHDAKRERDSYLWPVYQYSRFHSDPLDQERTRILFYLYSDTKEKNTATGKLKRRVDLWPFFVYHRDFNGNNRLQIIAPFETALPDNRGVERNWAPLWSLWRSENNPATHATSRSLLWNLYRRDTTPETKKVSCLFGLFQYQSDGEKTRLRLFYVPVASAHHAEAQPKQ